MIPRWPAQTIVDTLLRCTMAAGGFATVALRGDRDSGAILVDCLDRGVHVALLEFVHGADGEWRWRRTEASSVFDTVARRDPGAAPESVDAVAAYLARRRKYDPDLWAIELDIAQPEQFVAHLSHSS